MHQPDSIVGGTDLSQFKAGQDIIVTGSNLNDGTYRIAPGTPPTADRIALEFDPLNPVQLQNEPALANRAYGFFSHQHDPFDVYQRWHSPRLWNDCK